MLFELRDSTPEVSSHWIEARDLYLQGQSRRAWELVAARRTTHAFETANDYILFVEIARACSASRTYMGLVRMAARRFPHDPIVRLYFARVALTRGRHLQGIEYLLACENSLGKSHRAWWGTELANVYANGGFEASCRKWLDMLSGEPGMDSPLSLYSQSCAFEGMQQWDKAIEFARRCVAVAPDWTRVRAYLAHCLLARGKVEEAETEIAEAQRRGHEEALVDITATMLDMSLGRFANARLQLESILERWPQADFLGWVKRTLCILLVELGDYGAAREVAAGQESQFAIPPIPEIAQGRHLYIPLPPIAQNKNQCVPTSVAMAVYPQGHRFDSDVMFREMSGRDGTSLWRMRRWVEEHGFSLVPIRLEREGVVALLDRQIPLIGVLEGPFNSHVEVVCGYNDDLQTLYIRDPARWAPMALPLDLGLLRYQAHSGLMAIVEADRSDVLEVAEQWKSEECGALLDLSQAVAQGDLPAAESAYARVPDDSPAAFLRDGYSLHVVISPVRFRERMQMIAIDPKSSMAARFRALMTLPPEDSEKSLAKLLDEDQSGSIGIGVRRYLTLLRRMAEGQWPAAKTLVNQLLISGSGMSQIWEMKSDIHAELGEQADSLEALERAIELDPYRMALREKQLNRTSTRLTFTQYLSEFDSLLAQDPDDKQLFWGRASALRDGPDGKAYEEAARQAVRWFPRNAVGYSDLMDWYRFQGRHDLADALLLDARRLLPDVFVEGPAPGSESQNSPAKSSDEPVKPDLPTDKQEILNLVWSPEDPRRTAALRRALEMQEAGQLHWFEAAKLLACRLLIPEGESHQVIEPEKLLPKNPPGHPHWFARVVTDVLTSYEPSIRVALAVNDWLDQVVTDVRNYPELWFLRVLLLERGQLMERALAELRSLLERYPATSSALYRMGLVKYGQQDYRSAQRYFEESLEVNPGLFGAMEMLRKVHQWLGNDKESLECTRMLRRKLPYAISYLRDEVLALAERESVEAAQAIVDRAAGDFPVQRLAILHGRLLLAAGLATQADNALSQLSLPVDEPDHDLYEDWLQAKLNVALQTRATNDVLELCEQGLRRWPDSTVLKEIQAEQLAESEPEKAKSLLLSILHEGEPHQQSARQYLQIAGSKAAGTVARDVITNAPETRRQPLAELFAEVMGLDIYLSQYERYLEWAQSEYPESDSIRHRLLNHYNISAQAQKAIRLAEQHHARNPNNPEAEWLYGRCLMDQDPKRALNHLEKACQHNRAVDYLFDLARCYQLAGDEVRSERLHWEILEQNPYVACSWTNLYLLGADRSRLWPYVSPMVERGFGVQDEYFVVAVVLAALTLRQKLPVAWFPLAVRRYEILKTLPGFRDEQVHLTKCLLAWLSVRPGDGREYEGLPRDVFQSLAARFWWPRRAWIPKT